MSKTVRRKATAAAGLLLGALAAALAADSVGRQGTIEFVYGGYEMADARFKAVYPGGGPALGFALTAALFAHLDVSFEVKHLARTGALTYTKEETKFRLVPVSFGLRYVYPGKILQPFAGGGLDYNIYYENNPIGTTVNAARGFHVQAGLYLRFGPRLPILVVGKAKYVWATADKGGRAVDLGGLEYGGGLAFAF